MLSILTQVSAPFLPMIMEEIYTGLTGEQSVHLSTWPDATTLPDDPALVAAMDKTRDVVSTALRLREDQGHRVRLPLPGLTVAGPHRGPRALHHLITDEVNVKAVELSDDLDGPRSIRSSALTARPRAHA